MLIDSIASDVSVAFVTVICGDAYTPSKTAATLAIPGLLPVAHPAEPGASLIVATGSVPVTVRPVEIHVTEEETFCVVPSARVAVATNCVWVPFAIVTGVGVMAIDVRP